MNGFKWFLKFFGSEKFIYPGTRVRYQGYEGVILSGCLHVKFDRKGPWKPKSHPNDKTMTLNIENKGLEIL